MREADKRAFEQAEGIFHDGLGTFAELSLANEIIRLAGNNQGPYDVSRQLDKMQRAIDQLLPSHLGRGLYVQETSNIQMAAASAAATILQPLLATAALRRVDHVAGHFSGARAADLLLHFDNAFTLPLSVKTDKSGKVAVADGQTSEIFEKWAKRYFSVTPAELTSILTDLGFTSLDDLKAHYLNVAEFVVTVIITKLQLTNCTKTDLSHARAANAEAVRHLLVQLLAYKKGSDGSRVVILDRKSGLVIWETALDRVDLQTLSLSDVAFRPSIPKAGRRIGSEFGVKIKGQAVVTFQVKHRRGAAHGTAREHEFLDITTRLMV